MSEATVEGYPDREYELRELFADAARRGDNDALEVAANGLREEFDYNGLDLANVARTADRRSVPRETSPLTDREVEVLSLAALGMDNTEIGKRLHLARSTVKTYLDRSYVKLGVRDRTGAAVRALSHGWISIEQYIGEDRKRAL